MGQQGGVSGDCFVKVAYEEPDMDPEAPATDRIGRVRLLVLNSAHVFPEWHPHDRSRFLRVKIKYRFWGQAPEGTRQVYTYTEILTDKLIEEYINDELIRQSPNPLGVIPVAHCPNMLVSGSPWGLGDCHDIIALNREYNEKATDIADIVNYHAAPVTVVLGAKASNLEKGPKKVWAIPTAGADVKNLELGANLSGPLEYMETIKRAMHEMTGVPESALGQMQPISNTSGVALSIMFQPTMMKWHLKTNNYGLFIEKINQYALMTLFLKEPETLMYNPETDGPIRADQYPVLDPNDPITYKTSTHFPPPLPIDKLIMLNELGTKMSMNLESRTGALRALGEEFPEEKLEEIRSELREDALADGALNMLKAQISKEIMDLTGVIIDADGNSEPMPPPEIGPDGEVLEPAGTDVAGPGAMDMAGMQAAQGEMDLRNELVTRAYGTRVAGRQQPRSEGGKGESD